MPSGGETSKGVGGKPFRSPALAGRDSRGQPPTSPGRDRFAAQAWIQALSFAIFGGLGGMVLLGGVLLASGRFDNLGRDQVKESDSAPPLIISGCVCCVLAAPALVQLFHYRKPAIRCFSEGIECRIVAATSLQGIPLPRIIKLVWGLVSLQVFRVRIYRLPWSQFAGAAVSRSPMSVALIFQRFVGDASLGVLKQWVRYPRHVLSERPEVISDAINGFALNPSSRLTLPSWGSSEAA